MSMSLKTAESPFTGSATSEVWGHKDGNPVFRCPDTGALFFDRRKVSASDYTDYYPYLKDFDESRVAWEMAIRRRKYRKQLSLMARYAPLKDLLDIGAGPGYLCATAREQGWSARGCEISNDARQFGAENLGVAYVALEHVEAESVGAVTCHHVLEHLAEPMHFLRRIHQVLAADGLLVVHVPHQEPLTEQIKNRLFRARGSAREVACMLYGDEHITGFDVQSLQTVMQLGGFDTIFIKTTGMWSKFYDPFFFKNFMRSRDLIGFSKYTIWHGLNAVGGLFGAGDWIVGYFRKQ